MAAKTTTLGTAVTEDVKMAFTARAEALNTKPGPLLHDLVLKFLEMNPEPASAAPQAERSGRKAQVFVHLSDRHHEALRALAKARLWSRATYLYRLFCIHYDRRPQFCQAELEAVLQAARALADVGRNLNQVARAYNAGQFTHPCFATPIDPVELQARVDAVTAAVKALIHAHYEELGVRHVE